MVEREDSITPVLRILSRDTRRGRYGSAPVYRGPIEGWRSPFRVLVSCLVSTRTKDEQTTLVCERLFRAAPTPEAMLSLSQARLTRLLYGCGFYRQKARQIRGICRRIIELGGVPSDRDGLMALPGIGPKCANIVLASAFDRPFIAVDTHVHRISNRLGWVRTKTPEDTEASLTPLVPSRWRKRVNVLLVAHGQLVCKPIGPKCEECRVRTVCKRRGV